ncbi:MAG TPA: HlyC/CorC family transporter [Rhizomicrobium sp.]|jgi:Mg2+/Co2+ transporter CorB|nr:HlyC/CorC family transporter [Rhizomicrobium sp.]
MLLPALGVILLLLIVSAFFSGSETALTAVSRGRMHQLEKDGSRAARDVNLLVANREQMIGALLLGNTFINILASSLATEIFNARLGPRTVVVTTAVMTLAILVFAEVLPKTLAIARTDRVALTVAAPLRKIVAVLAPIVAAVQWLVWKLLFLFGVRAQQEESTEAAHDEIRGAVALHHQEGSVEREHRDMIGGILDLRDLTVADVMMHRTNVISVDADLPRQDIVSQVMDSQHTRVPLWRGEPENIIGVLHTKHLAMALIEHKGDFAACNVVELATPPWFVPETTTLEELMESFRQRRTHFALVVDEYGGLQGLVTLEDIFNEIFGELPDEHQQEERPDVRRRPDGSYLVDGTVTVRDLNRELEWNLPDEGATTVAGLVIQEAQTIPDPGQRFAFFGYKFEVLRRQRNQITAIKITPPPKLAKV